MTIDEILNNLEDEERRFVGQEFLAPVLGHNFVVVRIAGIVCRLRVKSRRPFTGWAVIRALSTSQAEFVRPANLGEIANYLALFPLVRLILLHSEQEGELRTWIARSAQQGDQRFNIAGPVPLRLAEEGMERFETVIARFDGHEFWYERRDSTRDPALAAYLREQLGKETSSGLPPKPEDLHKRGLSREERQAYGMFRSALEHAARDRTQERLSEALDHAGAKLISYLQREDVYVVRYTVDGRELVSTIHQDDLTVVSAGICLAGEDQHFDLTSLVGVLREASGGGQMLMVGENGLDEDEYWRIHPRQNPGG
jgi:hypothetical protein